MTAKKKTASKKNDGGDPAVTEVLQQISEGLGQVIGEIGKLRADVEKNALEIELVKNGDKDAFKRAAKPEDIEAAAENRKGVDPRVVAIVNETVGTDFGIEMAPLGDDRIGYLFTLAVPDRLNDNPIEQRPILEAPGVYKRDALGNVLMEDFKRPDRRSRMLSSADGYQAIREHCEKVRAYMHAYYAAKRQPMPELKVK